ncbi:MAG: ABC transporter permease [Burkholderiaceae bacterium]|nr:ABC transporter permease [Burkholderiaceae bacterium]
MTDAGGAETRRAGLGAWGPYAMVAPAFVFVLVVLLLPLLMMLRLSLNRYDPAQLYTEAFTLENYGRFFHDEFYQGVLLTTLGVSATTTLLCLVGGLVVAYYVARTSSPILQRYLIIAIIFPLFMGNVARTAGWMVVLDNRGMINYLVQSIGLASGEAQLLYTTGAVIVGLTSVLLPFMIVTLNSVMNNIDVSLEEASLNLGASPFVTFRRIVLPLLMPGIFAGSILCFILSMNAYATPVLLGGPSFHMMAPAIYKQVTEAMNWPFGAALAFVLIALTMTLTVASAVMYNRTSRRTTGR